MRLGVPHGPLARLRDLDVLLEPISWCEGVGPVEGFSA